MIFRGFIHSRPFPRTNKRKTLEAVLARPGLSETVANTLRLIARNSRLFTLPAMIAAFKTTGGGCAQ